MALTALAENAIINHFFRNSTQTPATTVYLALFSASPGTTGAATNELSGNGYARVAVTFAAPSAGSSVNSATASFPVASADWVAATYIGICMSGTGGTADVWDFATITSTTVLSGQQLTFSGGNLTLTFS